MGSIADESSEVRDAMTSYWKVHSQNGVTEKEMMLDSEAEIIGKQEMPEVLGMLPEYHGKDILEIGAGIGRFNGIVGKTAKSVIAVDFMESFTKKNKENNGHMNNVSFLCADAVTMSIPKNSVDIVFTNWLLMYLSDEEVHKFMCNVIRWLRPGGYLFFRESCFHSSGNATRDENPTKYRSPIQYNDLVQSIQEKNGKPISGLEIVMCRPLNSYIEIKNNKNQVCWLVQKVTTDMATTQGHKTFQEFLDKNQYARDNILKYEKIFGRNYVSTGGKETTEEFVKMLSLQPGQTVLDVGCGIGGSAFLMADQYGASVRGFDLSSNMIAIAMDRAQERTDNKVIFEVADATKVDFPTGTFDVVYSRDTILHIENKKALFQQFLKWLKPGGKLLISDYCCKDGEWSDVYKAYVDKRGYHLLSPGKYGKVIEEAGFVNVKAEDRTDQFVSVLKREMVKSETKQFKEDFLKDFTEKDFQDLTGGWKEKVHRCGLGDQKWGLFYAEKSK